MCFIHEMIQDLDGNGAKFSRVVTSVWFVPPQERSAGTFAKLKVDNDFLLIYLHVTP